ncbi:hypothetical protein KAR91_29755 [Candidatus Pacearchaeota archaeon]|nr:hypothetical protein [Candidatus Pacearchaeota archaeon]
MQKVTFDRYIELLLKNDSYHRLHEDIAHELHQITRTDEAIHTKNLYKASLMRPDNKGNVRRQYVPFTYEASRIEDEFAEFRTPAEKAVSA